MLDHYKTLGVPAGASGEEIKRAFRGLAKQFHPDRNTGRAAWATAQMKRVIEANRVLSDPESRALYDRRRAIHAAVEGRRPASRLKHRREADTPEAQAERILYDLVSGNPARAMAEYERLQREAGGYDIGQHLDLKDWIDCTFLIAEQYEKLGAYGKALDMYEELYHSEEAKKRYAYFLHEVRDRLLRLCTHEAPRKAPPTEAVQYYLRALGMDISRPQKAFLHKKIAECHLEIGDIEGARRHLGIALELNPNLKGATKIRRSVGG